MDTQKKIAGVLAPLSLLRGQCDFGAGDVGALREFIAWAARQGFGAVQILPVNEMCADFSPYNLRSAFALDPIYIETTPEPLPWLKRKDFRNICTEHRIESLRCGDVDYPRVAALKRALLEAAFAKFDGSEDFDAFCLAEKAWLDDYVLYRALLDLHRDCEMDWPSEHSNPASTRGWLARQGKTTREAFNQKKKFFSFVQWIAHTQWRAVNLYASELGVLLVGDVPVGVSITSHDVWANREIFEVERSCGAPPERVFQADAFTMRWGQNWGFPLYNWQAMSADNFSWWRRRLRLLRRIFPLLRVDHALGFFRIYSFPWRPQENERFTHLSDDEARAITGGPLPCFVDCGDEASETQAHNQRHGEMLMRVFLEEVATFVAEDLGEVPPYVRPTLATLQVPGFKIPQWERNQDASLALGSEYPRLSFTTFATHDHPPLRTMWNELFQRVHTPETAEYATREMRLLLDFCGDKEINAAQAFNEEIHRALLQGLLATNSWLAVHSITDIFGSTIRINTPGLAARNWTARIPEPIAQWDTIHADLLHHLHRIIEGTGRGR